MKKWIFAVLAVAVMAPSAQVLAQDSSETPPVKPVAGYDKGFYIRNPDGDFVLKIKGRLAPTYYFEKGKLGGESVNTFRVRTMQLLVTGTLAKDWGFTILLVNNTSNARTGGAIPGFNWGAEITYDPNPYFNLALGIETPPFDRFGEGSGGSRLFVDAPLVVTQSYALGIQEMTISRPAFGLSNAPGINVRGNIKDRFLYGIGVTNGPNPDGTQDYYSNFNKMMSGGVRFQYNVLKDPGGSESDLAWSETPALALGTGLAYEDMGSGDTSAPSIYLRKNAQATGDLTFKYKGLSLIGSWYGRIIYASTVGSNVRFTLQDQGFLAQAGYFVIPKKLELAARTSLIYREGPHNDSSDYYGGVNWYIYGNSIKWQTNVGLVRSFDTVDGTAGQRLWRVWSMVMMNI